jgi:prepilin-type N-terminal cleavage/methylation domain-containing protein
MRVRRAFTLIELLIVVAIVIVLTGMMVPVLQSGLGRSESRGALVRITNIMTLASSMAVAEGRTFRLNINPQEGRFWVTHERDPLNEPGVYVPYRLSELTDFRLGPGITVRWHELELREQQEGEPFIPFHADGTSERLTLVLITEGGRTWTIMVAPMTSAIRVVDFDITQETL